jgi:hypothetical protein
METGSHLVLEQPAEANIYFLDCTATNVFNGFSNARLVRGCTLTNVSGDALQNNFGIHNVLVNGLDPSTWRAHAGNDALTLTYTGAGTLVLKATGAPNSDGTSDTRTFTVELNGAQQGSAFVANNTVNSGNFKVSDLAGWFTGLAIPNSSAVVVNDARKVVHLSNASLAGPTAQFPAGGIAITAAGTTFTCIIDVHADYQQNFGLAQFGFIMENCGYRFAAYRNVGGDGSAQFIFNDHTNSSFRSMSYRNYETGTNSGIASRSQINSPHHSCVFEFITSDNTFDIVRANTNHAEDFQPTRVAIRNGMFEKLEYTGTTTALAGVTLDNNYSRTVANPAGSTNTPSGSGTSAAWSTLVVNEPGANFTPVVGGPLDVAHIGRYLTDGSERLSA